MRITITLEGDNGITLPITYNSYLQGLIYRQIDNTLANWLHNEAYRTPTRQYRLFTFSRLRPAVGTRYKLHNGTIHYPGPANFTLASVNTDLLRSLAENLLKTATVKLGKNTCMVRGVEVLKQPQLDFDHPIRVRALSPITVYQTFTHPSGNKKTYYFSPHEREWHTLLRDNLARKAQALNWEDDAKETLQAAQFKPLRVQQQDQKVVTYKGTVIKGWMGTYELTGLTEGYFELAYDAGLGPKNSQGFGMVEVLRHSQE